MQKENFFGVARPAEQRAETRRWSHGLETVAKRIDRHFARAEARGRLRAYLRGLLSPIERKNGWQLAEALGYRTPHGVQHLLGRAEWSADAVRDDLLGYVKEHLADPQGILVIDETGFLKKGTKSVGVARQYSGAAGRVENCQIGVFAAYVSPTRAQARTLVDRALYLPKAWAEDAERRRAARVPESVRFAAKPQLARQLIGRVREAGLPCAWVVADPVYGTDSRLRAWLEAHHQPYVLAVSAQYRIFDGRQIRWAADLVKALPARAWKKLSAGSGTKGERLYQWACFVIRSIDEGRQRWLLARRSLKDRSDRAYHVVSGPKATALEEMVRVAGTRWAIEESFQIAKDDLGLDQYEVRSWQGWHRHVTLVMLVQAYLTVLRAQEEAQAPGPSLEAPAGQKKSLCPAGRGGRARVDPMERARSAPVSVVAGVGPPWAADRADPELVPLAPASPSRRARLPPPAATQTPPEQTLSATVGLQHPSK
jgi:SRSO17 transposase